jgi:transcriptional regulator with XRE-family HTH domain
MLKMRNVVARNFEEKKGRPMDNPDLVELGKNIQKQREFLGKSQEELGLDVGSNKNTIYLYETAQRTMKVDRLFEIADALMVTPTELCPNRFNRDERIDPRLYQIGEMMKKLSPEKRAAAYRAMEALAMGFQTVE